MRGRNTVASLFGATPQQIMAQQAERERSLLASVANNPYQQVGTAIGIGLGRLFGGESQEMTEAQQRQEEQQKMMQFGAEVEQEAAARGMESLSPTQELMKRANTLQTMAQRFAELGQPADVVSGLENEALATRFEALKQEREEKQYALGMKVDEAQLSKLNSEIARLNTPDQLTIKDKFALAKDFTPDSVKKAIDSGNPADLVPSKDVKDSNYVVMNRTTGYDNNGQPIIEPMLVDKTQVGTLTGGSPVVSVEDLTQRMNALGVTTSPATPTAVTEDQPQDTKANTIEDLPGIRELPVKDQIELRESTMSELLNADVLIADVFSPEFEEVAGLMQTPARLAALAVDSPLAPIAKRMEEGAIMRAIQVAGDLGVNPTDKDFEVALKAAPGPDAGPRVWRDWTERQFVPKLKAALAAKYGSNTPRVQALQLQLDTALQRAKTSQQKTQTTSSGTKYTVIEK